MELIGKTNEDKSIFVPLRDNLHKDRTVQNLLDTVHERIRKVLDNYSAVAEKMESLTHDEIRRTFAITFSFGSKSVRKGSFSLAIDLCDDNYELVVEFDELRHEKEFVLRLANHYQNIVSEMMDANPVKLCDIRMFDENDLKKMMAEAQGPRVGYPVERTINELVEMQAAKTPENIAVAFGDMEITYAMLNEKANQLVGYLRKKGVKKDTVVVLLMDRSIEIVVAIIATLKAGGAYLPIDAGLPKARIAYMLKDSGAKVILTDSSTMKEHLFDYTILQNYEAYEGNEIHATEKRGHIVDFDKLCVPDRSLIDLSKYKDKIGMASVTNCISIQTTRGCSYDCLYCHKIWSKKHVSRSASNIFDEINYYYKNGVRNFAVIDDCFNLDTKNSSELFHSIIKNKLDLQLFFPNGLRGDIMTPQYIDLMVQAGTKGVNLSLETASPRLQKMLKKNLNLDRFRETISYIATQHPEIILELASMHGFPTETEEEAMMTLNFIMDNIIKTEWTASLIFPFSTNVSQQIAVFNALQHNFSAIQGPPGTGKTQTILNIIANIILNNKTVAVVSGNNEATRNVEEKLLENGFGLFCHFKTLILIQWKSLDYRGFPLFLEKNHFYRLSYCTANNMSKIADDFCFFRCYTGNIKKCENLQKPSERLLYGFCVVRDEEKRPSSSVSVI